MLHDILTILLLVIAGILLAPVLLLFTFVVLIAILYTIFIVCGVILGIVAVVFSVPVICVNEIVEWWQKKHK